MPRLHFWRHIEKRLRCCRPQAVGTPPTRCPETRTLHAVRCASGVSVARLAIHFCTVRWSWFSHIFRWNEMARHPKRGGTGIWPFQVSPEMPNTQQPLSSILQGCLTISGPTWNQEVWGVWPFQVQPETRRHGVFGHFKSNLNGQTPPCLGGLCPPIPLHREDVEMGSCDSGMWPLSLANVLSCSSVIDRWSWQNTSRRPKFSLPEKQCQNLALRWTESPKATIFLANLSTRCVFNFKFY